MTNEHIELYLKDYFETEASPGFAVLLQGEWGCGKTWFVNKYRAEYELGCPSKYKRKFLYVSLNAVTTVADIEFQLFQQLHPTLSSKPMLLTGKIVTNLLKGSLNWKFGTGQGTMTINPSLSDFELPDFLTKTENCILIFDDLERCRLPIEETLGYINSFVEHQGLRALLVANEEELRNIEKEKSGNSSAYLRIKEKLIGKTFRVKHDVDAAFDTFTGEVSDKKTNKFLRAQKEHILNTFTIAGYKNLRHLKQTLWDFARFYSNIPPNYRSFEDLMREILTLFLAFSFEIKAGAICSDDIRDMGSVYTRYHYAGKQDQPVEPLPIDNILKKYAFIDPKDTILPEEYWRELFDRGFLVQEKLKDSLQNSRYCQDENTPNWIKLYRYLQIEDDEFFNLYANVLQEWEQRSFAEPGQILHISGLFLRFSQIGLHNKSLPEMLKECKKYVDAIKDTGVWGELTKNEYGCFFEKEQWGGMAYTGRDLQEFDEIFDYLYSKVEEAIIEYMPIAGEKLLAILLESPERFKRMVTLSNSQEQIYFETPIFTHINAQSFFETWLKLRNEKKGIIGHAIKERYQIIKIASRLRSEIPFLEELDIMLAKEGNDRKTTISGYILEELRRQYLQAALSQLKNLQQ